ncbi:MAG TPA: hypothetical protein VMV49_15455 [Candidatus Deferrimicrobium sp.]|nr:hypothetical protein [Candidatus Deferrimicrobium sp.]
MVYIRWHTEDSLVYFKCGSPVQFLYNEGGRFVVILIGKLKLYTYYYACTNETCIFASPFTLPHDIILPYIHYGLYV